MLGEYEDVSLQPSLPREPLKGKSKERRKSDVVTGTRETLLRQMMDVPSPAEQACQIPSQHLSGQEGTSEGPPLISPSISEHRKKCGGHSLPPGSLLT